MWTWAPSVSRAARTRDSLASDPLTGTPRASITRATPDIPAPPMAMKWTDPKLLAAGTSVVKSKRAFDPLAAWTYGAGVSGGLRSGVVPFIGDPVTAQQPQRDRPAVHPPHVPPCRPRQSPSR